MLGITRSRKLIEELLSRPDDFVTVTVNGKEHVIKRIANVKTHANSDDSVMHLTLECDSKEAGNIIRYIE